MFLYSDEITVYIYRMRMPNVIVTITCFLLSWAVGGDIMSLYPMYMARLSHVDNTMLVQDRTTVFHQINAPAQIKAPPDF